MRKEERLVGWVRACLLACFPGAVVIANIHTRRRDVTCKINTKDMTKKTGRKIS